MQKRLGRVLKTAREARGLTPEQVEERTSRAISATTVALLEAGSICWPKPAHLRALARVYGVPYLELLQLGGIVRAADFERRKKPQRRAA